MENKSLYKQTLSLLKSKQNIDVYVDMDGVLAEYVYGEGEKILNGETTVYLNKRPIKTIAKLIKKYYTKNSFYIVTSCKTFEQFETKKQWIKKHLPFFNLENVYCVFSENFSDRIGDKVKYIGDLVKSRNNYSILIEDTHEILKRCWENNKESILPVLVINLIK